MAKRKQSGGFTIVELLIVIIVIGILAAIILVAYNGVQNSAKTSAVQATVSQAGKKILAYSVQNSDQYPATLADAGVIDTSNMDYQYTSDNTVSPRVYCVTVSNGSAAYYISSATNRIGSGICPGQNLIVWDKGVSTLASTAPIPAATVDTSVFRTATASMRLGPGTVGKALRGSPFSGTSGQIYTVTLWIKTDSTWNGILNNSKIRFGDPVAGTPLAVCAYNGVKLTWTQVTCSYTMAAISPVNITVGNDGTVGNIWIDDVSVSLSP